MDVFGIIYKVTNKINGKVYIGQTTQSFKKRKYNHLYAAKTDKYSNKCRDYFHKALTKYGFENFVWCVLEVCDSKHNLDLAEQWYIRYYKSFVGFISSNGYNLTMGGNGNSGLIFSDEHRMKLSKSRKGRKLSEEHKQKIRDNAKTNPNFGNKDRKMSDEAKEKLRKCNLGKKHSQETKRKMSISQTIRTNYRKGWKHTKQAKEKMSISTSGKLNPMYGIPCPHTGKFGKNNHLAKKYVIVTPNGEEFIIHGMFNFCNKYKKELLYHNVLIKVARGKQIQHKGYKCRYYNKKLDSNLSYWECNCEY